MDGKGRFDKSVVVRPEQPRMVRSLQHGSSTWVSEAKSSTAVQGTSDRRYRLPFGCSAVTSASTFPINLDCFQRKRDGAPIRLFHAGSVQDLSLPQGAR